jgi:thiamine-monophosphate kinase
MAENEQQMIRRLLAPLASGLDGALGLQDDAALLTPPEGCEFVVTMDTLIDGGHFLFDGTPHSAELAARKALAVNVSDLAAKAADPFAYFLSIALPASHESWLDGFVIGLRAAQLDWSLHLAGGDTVGTQGRFTVTITAVGTVPNGRMVRRSTARAGDVLFVTGTIGDAVAGLSLAQGTGEQNKAWRGQLGDDGIAELLARSRTPAPRVKLISALRRYANAALDISDGLALDASRLADASGLAVEIDGLKVPLSEPIRLLIQSAELSLADIVSGGDDYEILAAVAPENAVAFAEMATAAGQTVTKIGWLSDGSGLTVYGGGGETVSLKKLGWDHLTRSS